MGGEGVRGCERSPGLYPSANRASPFAFTGNRFEFFEFRAVGFAQSAAGSLIALNTFLPDSTGWVADRLESRLESGASLDRSALETIKHHERTRRRDLRRRWLLG